MVRSLPMMSMSSVSDGVRVPKVALLIFGLLCFAPQFFFGFVGSGLLTPLGWSLGMAMFAVGTGWRAPQKGIPTSVLIGTCYAAAANVPFYLIGRWLGDPTSSSAAFTAIASVLGLLTFGSLDSRAPHLAAAAEPREGSAASSGAQHFTRGQGRL